MPIDLGVPGEQLRVIARALKQGMDDLQEQDSGWRYVQFDHPVLDRPAAAKTAERIPGGLLVSTEEPGEDADALVVVTGFVDSFTGDVHLGNGMVVPGFGADVRAPGDGDDGEGVPSERLPAVALYVEGGQVQALLGSVHGTRESRFELVSTGPTADQAMQEWLEGLARGEENPVGSVLPPEEA